MSGLRLDVKADRAGVSLLNEQGNYLVELESFMQIIA